MYQSYQQQPNQGSYALRPAAAASVSTLTPVQRYTQYYHQWTALEKQYQAYGAQQPPNIQEQYRQQAQWAKYYADQSSRAAHYCHQNPQASKPPFDIPEPPTSNTASTTNAPAQQPQQYQPQQQPQQYAAAPPSAPSNRAASSSTDRAPDSLQRYVDRCLQAAPDKAAMMKHIEATMARAMETGTLHSTNWDQVPLPPMLGSSSQTPPAPPNMPTPVANQPGSYYGQTPTGGASQPAIGVASQSTGSYYGPPATAVAQPNLVSKPNSDNSSYYGPASSSPAWQKSQPVQQYSALGSSTAAGAGGYYGPSSSQQPALSVGSATPVAPPSKKQKTTPDGYYGPASSASHSLSHNFPNQQQQSIDNEDDFIALPQYGGKKTKKKKKAKQQKFASSASVDSGGGSYSPSTSPSAARRVLQRRSSSGFNSSTSALSDRAKRFAGPGGLSDAASTKEITDMDRFLGKGTIHGGDRVLDESDYEAMTVKGTCTTLEKDYLRLTAPPKAELVRPQPILEAHMKNLKAERQEKEYRRDYLWFCSQLKAVRQDCRVQRFRNAFAVDVYETHARIALEEGDLNEFNQCQTQLKELYALLSESEDSTSVSEDALKNQNEFVAYRLLYYVLLNQKYHHGGDASHVLPILRSVTATKVQDAALEHALAVRVAVSDMDYHAFFRLWKQCPNLSSHLVDPLVPIMRLEALKRICRAYRPSVEVPFVLSELGFAAETDSDLKQGRKWLESCGCVISKSGTEVQTKESVVRESNLEDKKVEDKKSFI